MRARKTTCATTITPARAALALLLVIALALAACAPFQVGSGGQSSPPISGAPSDTPPPNLSPRALPAFHDWRATYIGQDGTLRAVSLNGKHDDAGSALPIAGYAGQGVFAAGSDPTDALLAYFSDGRLSVVNAATGALHTWPVHTGDSLISWSPDGRRVALNGIGAVITVVVADGSNVSMPPRAGAPLAPLVGAPDGWLDAAHIAVESLADSSDTQATLASLNVATGALRPIATLDADPGASFSVAPGGQTILFWTAKFRAKPYTPQAALIDAASGLVTPLPTITAALTTYGFLSLLWRPGTTQALAVTLIPGSSTLTYDLLDVAQDTVTPITLPGVPEGWSPDGATLLLATNPKHPITEDAPGFNDIGAQGAGPFTLSAVQVSASGGLGRPTTLTTHAMIIPTLGFVRTA